MNAHVEGRMKGAALGRLTQRQVWVLLGELLKGWILATGSQKDDLAQVMAYPAHPFHAWRRTQAGRLSQARQEDYARILEFALRLQGRSKQADAVAVQATCEPRARALHAFHQAVRECRDAAWSAGDRTFDPIAYAGGFLRKRRGVNLDDADAKTIWHAYYLLKKKAGIYARDLAEVPF
jgi:hypothetical protein